MSTRALAFASALCVATICGTSAQAAVTVYNNFTLPVDDTSVYSGRATTVGNAAGNLSFQSYQLFSIDTAPVGSSVSYADTVRFAANAITGGMLSLFSCASNCTGGGAPVAGTLLASAPIINMSGTSQTGGFGPVTLASVGNYFLEITGNTRASTSVTYTGTISLSSMSGGVPEPSTWAMMLLGFLGLACAYGRSNRTTTAIA